MSEPEPNDQSQWLRAWQESAPESAALERMARVLMARVWRFDQKIFWRNFREYAAGIMMLVVFAGMVVLGKDRTGGWIGIGSVGFVMAYLWWKHRGLHPLDPAASLATYRAAMLQRYDDQIRLLRSIVYWYLLPLSVWPLWIAAKTWQRSPPAAVISLAVLAAAYTFVGRLNVKTAAGKLRQQRAELEAMFKEDEA
jgi:hypothetical protein